MIDGKNPSLPEMYIVDPKDDFFYGGTSDLNKIRSIEVSQPTAELNTAFNLKYGDTLAFEGFIELISENIPVGSGLIIPPYMFYIRDSLPSYNIFFQEHHDGNIMMGSPYASQFFLSRMEALLGETYFSFPTAESGLNYSYMRNKFHDLDVSRLNKLVDLYSDFEYLIVEKSQLIDKPEIASNDFYTIYKTAR
jgi:hypothetical protein